MVEFFTKGNMTTLTKAEACALLHISDSTMTRRLKAGIYQCTRTGEGQYARLSFSYSDLGLTEPQPEPPPAPVTAEVSVQPKPQPTPEPETFAPRQLSSLEQKQLEDAAFASAYLRGEATDSLGNSISGNAKFPTLGKQTALGPIEPQFNAPPSTTAHMVPELAGGTPMTGTDGEPVMHAGSDNHPLNCERTYELFRKPGQPSYADLHSIKPKLPHPNANRQAYLDAIWIDIRNGWSR